MSDNTILAELERLASEFEATAKTYRAAADLLRGTNHAPSSSSSDVVDSGTRGSYTVTLKKGRKRKGPTSTMSMIRTVLNSEHRPIATAELSDKMLAGGWETSSENPSNTVRTAVMRLVERGEVQRHDDGTFSLPSDLNRLEAADDEFPETVS